MASKREVDLEEEEVVEDVEASEVEDVADFVVGVVVTLETKTKKISMKIQNKLLMKSRYNLIGEPNLPILSM